MPKTQKRFIGFILVATLAGCSSEKAPPPKDPEYWHRLKCVQPKYRYLESCKAEHPAP